jgi:hypothetical protein
MTSLGSGLVFCYDVSSKGGTLMSKLTLDPGLRSKLNGFTEPMEVCDEAGKTCGFFLPHDTYRKLLGRIPVPFSEAELEQFRQSGDGRPLADLWKQLGVA